MAIEIINPKELPDKNFRIQKISFLRKYHILRGLPNLSPIYNVVINDPTIILDTKSIRTPRNPRSPNSIWTWIMSKINAGNIGICCIPSFLGNIRVMLDHMDYVVENFGVDHAAIGTDVAYVSRNAAKNMKNSLRGERHENRFGRQMTLKPHRSKTLSMARSKLAPIYSRLSAARVLGGRYSEDYWRQCASCSSGCFIIEFHEGVEFPQESWRHSKIYISTAPYMQAILTRIGTTLQ